MEAVYTSLIFAMVAVSWILSSSARGADIRMANGVRLHYETSGTGELFQKSAVCCW